MSLPSITKAKILPSIFEKTSTRTRCSFEVAAHDLGMGSTYLDQLAPRSARKRALQIQQEFWEECMMVSNIVDLVEEIVEDLAKHAGVPVWNGLTNEYHPTQMLADMLTIREHFGYLKGIKLVYMGDARYNMGNSHDDCLHKTWHAFRSLHN